MTVNEILMRRTLDGIRFDLEHWDQDWWVSDTDACGTTYCVAGWAYVLGTGRKVTEEQVVGEQISIALEAKKLLGLDLDQARKLFYFTPEHYLPEERKQAFEELVQLVKTLTGIEYGEAA